MYWYSLVILLVLYYLLNALVYLKYSWHEHRFEGRMLYYQPNRHDILSELILPPGSLWITLPAEKWQRRVRKQKWGSRAGVRARLSRHPHKPSLPSLLFMKDRLPTSYIYMYISTQKSHQDCSVIAITDMWLNSNIQVEDTELAGCIAHRFERTSDSGKSRGGGLCFYTNNNWCTNTVTTDTYCLPTWSIYQ